MDIVEILIISDTHIPNRAKALPEWFYERLKGKHILFHLGDFTSKHVFDEIDELCNKYNVKFYGVMGNVDDFELDKYVCVDVLNIKICGTHGNQIYPRGDLNLLDKLGKSMGANIFLHGHTHKLSIDLYNKTLFINPGSLTAAGGGSFKPQNETAAEIKLTKDGGILNIEVNNLIDGEAIYVGKYGVDKGKIFKQI